MSLAAIPLLRRCIAHLDLRSPASACTRSSRATAPKGRASTALVDGTHPACGAFSLRPAEPCLDLESADRLPEGTSGNRGVRQHGERFDLSAAHIRLEQSDRAEDGVDAAGPRDM